MAKEATEALETDNKEKKHARLVAKDAMEALETYNKEKKNENEKDNRFMEMDCH